MNREDGIEWLRSYLGSDVKSSLGVQAAASAAGLGIAGLKVARTVLDVQCFRDGLMGPFFMCLPGVEHPDFVKHKSGSGVDDLTDEQRATSLAVKWHKARRDSSPSLPGLFEQVQWVAERKLLPLSLLTVADIPSLGALDQLLWAKSNEDAWRQMYDSKRWPARIAVPATKKSSPSRIKPSSEADGQAAIDRLLGSGAKAGGIVKSSVPLETGDNGS